MQHNDGLVTVADAEAGTRLLADAEERAKLREAIRENDQFLMVLMCTTASLAVGQLCDQVKVKRKHLRRMGQGVFDMALITARAVQSAYESFLSDHPAGEISGPVVTENVVDEVLARHVFRGQKSWAELEQREPVLGRFVFGASKSIASHLCQLADLRDDEKAFSLVAGHCLAAAVMTWDALRTGYDAALARSEDALSFDNGPEDQVA